MASMKISSSELKPFIVMFAIDLVFASVNILLKKVLDEGINHLVLVTYRLSISTLFLAPIAYFWERKSRPKLTARILCNLFLSAIVGTSLTQYLYLLGIQYTSATFSCAFVNMVPVITFVMALTFRMESVTFRSNGGRAKIIGSVVCVVGALLLTVYKGKPVFGTSHLQSMGPRVEHAIMLSSGGRAKRWRVGSIALIGGTLLWSSWFLVQSNVAKLFPCQYSSTAIMSLFGALQSAILTLLINRNLSEWVLKGKTEIITVLYAGMIGSGLCFVGMAWCVKRKGPVFAAAFSPIIQIIAALLDVPILREQLHLGSLLGSIMVIIGLYILLWGKSKEMQNSETKVAQEAKETTGQEAQLQVITVPLPCDSQFAEAKGK